MVKGFKGKKFCLLCLWCNIYWVGFFLFKDELIRKKIFFKWDYEKVLVI